MEVSYYVHTYVHVCGNVRLVLHREIFRPPSAIMHVLHVYVTNHGSGLYFSAGHYTCMLTTSSIVEEC